MSVKVVDLGNIYAIVKKEKLFVALWSQEVKKT
jgi:hypothetical protein